MLGGALLACACTGSVWGDGPGSGGVPLGGSQAVGGSAAPVTPPGVQQFAKARVRRLTAQEIKNSASDVFLSGAAVETAFPDEPVSHEFANRYDNLGVSLPVVEALQAHAESVASLALARFDALLPCNLTIDESSCSALAIEHLGELAYRRPLEPEDVATLRNVYTEARSLVDAKTALATVIEAMLQSPFFLFRTELGASADAGKPLVRLSAVEVASALSFHLWNAGPDRALLEAAYGGQLDTKAGLLAEAERLSVDARTRRGLRDFFLQWFEVDGVERAGLSRDTYPEFTSAYAASTKAAAAELIDRVTWVERGALADLLTAGALGSGLLTEPAFLATHSRPSSFTPVFLGHFVRSKLLCEPLPPPPNDVPALPVEMSSRSTRERFAQHSSSPECQGCHVLMDPIGFGFERYDALGRTRDLDPSGAALTGSGSIAGSDVAGDFVGPAGLASRLAASGQVQDCFAAHLLERALGRETSDPGARLDIDDAAIAELNGRLGSGPSALIGAFAAAATSDALLLRDASGVPAGGQP